MRPKVDDTSRGMITELFVRAVFTDLDGDSIAAAKMMRAAEILFEMATPPDERFNVAVEKIQRLT